MTQEQDAFKMFEVIFREPPKAPNSYNLQLEESNPDNENIRFDDILINIFFTGLKVLFGESVNLGNITQDQYEHINTYMYSLGYKAIFDYEYDENNIPINIKVWFEKLTTV
jgi:hypothetical protein